ncbi:hypothetical protein [Paenibacillus assamensis]|uniref:hypothetical protein n=1 Tax=Paenibacillus assamensis TaxID=311244 RepID=UPI00048FE50E|nr:hypothetical protein [Paenibacillus assamensis]
MNDIPIYDNVGGTWRSTKDIYDNVGGIWRPTKVVSDNVGGVWRSAYKRNAFSNYFSEYIVNPTNLYGTRRIENHGSFLYTEISGYTNGDYYPTQAGWKIINLPHNCTVELDWELLKGQYPRNDALVINHTGTHIHAETQTFSRKKSVFTGQSNSMLVIMNFFSTWQITSWFKIYGVTVNGKKIYPIG